MHVPNFSLLVNNHGLRDPFDFKAFPCNRLWIEGNGKTFPFLLLKKFLYLLGFLALVDGNERNFVLGEGRSRLHQLGQCPHARTAPGRPEVQDHYLALMLGQVEFRTVQKL